MILQCLFSYSQPTTDWQLMNLKGKIKSLKIYTYSNCLKSLKMFDIGDSGLFTDYYFDTMGYKQFETTYSIGVSTGMKFIHMNLVYTSYELQKRMISGDGGFDNRDYCKEQEWVSPYEYHTTSPVGFLDNQSIIIGRCDTEGRLIYMEESYRGINTITKKEFQYNETGQLACIWDTSTTNNSKILKSTEVVIVALDIIGNPVKEVYYQANGSTITMTYKYDYYE